MLLGLIVMAVFGARNPDLYGWLFAFGGGGTRQAANVDGAAGRSVDTQVRPSPEAERIPGTFVSPGTLLHSEETSSRYFDGVQSAYLSKVRDDTRSRSAERDAQFHLFALLQRTDPAELRTASTGRATFIQLFQQPDAYRGELVTIRGTVVRAYPMTAPANEYGVQRYYEAWLCPADNLHNPIVARLLELPEGFPTGKKVSAEVEITGFFFKRWAYQAQDTLRSAPVVLARSVEWKPVPTPVAANEIRPASILLAIVGSGVFALLIAWLAYRRTSGPGPSKRELPPRLKIVPALALLLPLACAEASAAAPEPIPDLGPRGVFELLGIDQSQFDRFIDGRPLHQDEEEVLLKLVRVLSRDLEGIDFQQWSLGPIDAAHVGENPGAYRGELFRVSGRVVRVESLEPGQELAERFEVERYYRCEFLLGKEAQDKTAVVFSRTIPSAWKLGEEISEPAVGWGFFLKLSGDDPGRPLPVLVAPRVAWYPDTPLGRLGMDCGLLDEIRMGTPGVEGSDSPLAVARNDPSLLRTVADRTCFYEMLDAAGRAAPGELLRLATEELQSRGEERFPVEPLFNRPGQQQGRLVAFSGTVRRVQKVRVVDEEVLARLGIDHFYEMYLFTDDSRGNPLVFCVRRLPPGMPEGEGPGFAENVTLAGFFLKTWAFQIKRPKDVAKSDVEYQFAPLLIGDEPLWNPSQPEEERPFVGLTAGLVVLLVLLVVWLTLYRISRGDRRQRGRLKCLGERDSPNGPDFSDLTKQPDFED